MEADQLAAKFQASGLTRREFCEQHRVALNTLNRYISRYGRSQQGRALQLVRVEVAESICAGAGIAVVLGNRRRVELAKGFDAATLAQAVSVLERL